MPISSDKMNEKMVQDENKNRCEICDNIFENKTHQCIFKLFNTDSSAALFDINEFDTLQIFLHTREVRFFGLRP